MFDTNQITLCGHVARAPRIHVFPDGSRSAVFSIGTNRSWVNPAGERQEAVTFNQINATGYSAEVAAEFDKGHRVLIIGSLETRSYESNGATVYVTEVVCGRRAGHTCCWVALPERQPKAPPTPPKAGPKVPGKGKPVADPLPQIDDSIPF
jgi:single stranded DNA-binding protein